MKHSYILKITSSIVVLALIVSGITPYIPNVQAETPTISIPIEFGEVNEIYFPKKPDTSRLLPDSSGNWQLDSGISGDKLIIYIQDAHDSLEAQENTAKLINHLVGQNGVKTVLEEGYEGEVPTDEYFGFIKDPAVKEKVSYFLMDHLRIGGAEYAHINRKSATVRGGSAGNSGGDFKLIGADSIKLHLENISWYKESAKRKRETDQDIDLLARKIDSLIKQYFPKELKEWLKLQKRHHEDKLGLLDYLKRTVGFMGANVGARAFDRGSKKYEVGSMKDQNSKANNPTSYFLPHTSAYPTIHLLLTSENSKDEKLLEQLKAIDSKVLFEEIDLLERDFAKQFLCKEPVIASEAKFAKRSGGIRPDESRQHFGGQSQITSSPSAPRNDDGVCTRNQTIFEYHQAIELLKRLSDIQITPPEYEAVKSTLRNLKTKDIADFIAKNTKKPVVLSKLWERTIQNAVQFYEVAQIRDKAVEIHLDDFIQDPNESVAILVYGGFHKNEIKELLKKKNLTYQIVSPKITEFNTKHRDFYKQLMTVGFYEYEVPYQVARASVPQRAFELPREAVTPVLRGLGNFFASNPAADPRDVLVSRKVEEYLSAKSLDTSYLSPAAGLQDTSDKRRDTALQNELSRSELRTSLKPKEFIHLPVDKNLTLALGNHSIKITALGSEMSLDIPEGIDVIEPKNIDLGVRKIQVGLNQKIVLVSEEQSSWISYIWWQLFSIPEFQVEFSLILSGEDMQPKLLVQNIGRAISFNFAEPPHSIMNLGLPEKREILSLLGRLMQEQNVPVQEVIAAIQQRLKPFDLQLTIVGHFGTERAYKLLDEALGENSRNRPLLRWLLSEHGLYFEGKQAEQEHKIERLTQMEALIAGLENSSDPKNHLDSLESEELKNKESFLNILEFGTF